MGQAVTDNPDTSPYSVTRRHFFSLAAYAGLGISPTWNILGHVLANTGEPFTYEVSEQRIAFLLDGRERWVIDTHCFSGNPQLSWIRQNGSVRVQLSDARFPGTQLPADFTCELTQGPLSWRMKLSFTLGAFQCEFPFVRWLARKEPARAPVHLNTQVCELDQAGDARLDGLAEADFSPDWIFRFYGRRIARIHGFGLPLESDAVRVALRDARSTSFVTDAAPSRTLITLERGTRTWSFAPQLASNSGGHLTFAENTFDALHLETFDHAHGRGIVALYAEGNNTGSGATFSTVHKSPTESLEPFKIPLASARYLRLFGRSPHAGEQAFLAQLPSSPVTINVQGCHMEVAGGDGVPPFEFLQHPTTGHTLCCEPAIHSISVPLPGAIAEPLHVRPGTRLRVHPQGYGSSSYLVASPTLQEKRPLQQLITPPPSSPSPLTPKFKPGASVEKQPAVLAVLESDFRFQLHVGGPGSVSVVRPEDLLVLQIAWQGLELRITPGPAQLVRVPSQAGAKPLLTIAFPPQHIGEESFFEESNPKNSKPVTFPIQARLAGWSRLIFEIPDEIQSIPYTLEHLLDWSQLRPVVAPVAWPPPAESVASSGFLRGPKDLSPFLQTPRLLYPQSFHKRPPAIPRWYDTSPSSCSFRRIAAVLSRSEARPFPVQLQQRDRLSQKDILTSPPASAVPVPRQQLRPGSEAVSPMIRIITQRPPASAKALAAYSSIEVPYRLFLSPSPLGSWSHAIKPVVFNGRHELWHTRLGVKRPDGSVNEKDFWYCTLRAIWSPDYADDVGKGPDFFDRTGPSSKNPFRMLPEANHRHQLVHLMANGTLVPDSELSKWQSRVARAQKFMLSSLGAWTDLRYADPDPPSGLTLVEWRQIVSMGRDQYVRVVEKGFLFPFGHRALLVHVTERKFERVDGRSFAVLRYREFIVVLEPIKKYPAAGHPASARDFAFQQIQITTRVTPNLSPPALLPGIAGRAFWPQVNGQDFQFQVLATDWAGQTSEFSTSLMFVDGNVGTNWEGMPGKGGQIEKVAVHYNSPAPVTLARRTCALEGQKVAFAPTGGGGQTTLETVSVILKASTIPANPSGKKYPLFFPHVEAGKVLVPPLKQLIGKDVTTIHYFSGYVAQGFGGPNPGEVFAVLDPPELIRFPTNKSGGIAAPNFTLTGLSRRLGPVGGDLGVVAGSREVNASDFFTTIATRGDEGPSQDAANILGCIPLGAAIKGKLPSFLRMEQLPQANPNSRWVILNLETELQPLPSASVPIFVPWLGFPPTANEKDLPTGCCRAKLLLHVHSRTPLPRQSGAGITPRSVVRGSLSNFQLNLGILIISFKEIGFASTASQGAGVTVRLADPDPVRFAGPLVFLEVFRKFITNDVLGTLPVESLQDRARGVASTFIPSVPMGMFRFDNVAFTIGFDMPYDNSPMTFNMGFASSLSLGPYQGRTTFGIGYCADGIRKLELSMEFGGKFEINLYVAKGGGGLSGRIYYKLEFITSKTFPWRGIQVELGGAVRLSGHVSVLGGLVGAGVDFELGLQLDIGTEVNRVWGKAELSVKVELLWHEESVSIPIELEFTIPRLIDRDTVSTRAVGPATGTGAPRQGGPDAAISGLIRSPVRIVDVLTERDWVEYAGAFAVDP